MIFLLSPAKTLDFTQDHREIPSTRFRFLPEAKELVSQLKHLSAKDIGELMHISPQLAQLNYERFQVWREPIADGQSKQALLAFKGDVYTGIGAQSLSAQEMEYAYTNIRILSGLYGLLCPTDLIQPYRLEMGTSFANNGGINLYQFWGGKISKVLKKDIAENDGVLINLASNEYYKSVQPKALGARIITPEFKDEKNGSYKVISFYAKKARGLMCRFAAKHGISDPEALKSFDTDGYFFDESESTESHWVFKRMERRGGLA